MMKKKVYMLVTKDKYELPIMVCDSPREMAEKLGKSQRAILSALSHHRKGIVRLEIEVEDE